MKIAISILLLLAVSYATQTNSGVTMFMGVPMNFGPRRSFITLLTQIEARMKMGGPFDAISKMLDDFKQVVTEEQVAHDNLFEKQQKSCQDELEFREKEISEADGARRASKETLDGCQAQQQRAKGDIATTKQQLGETSEFISVIVDNQRRLMQNFETDISITQQIIKATEECLIYLEELLQGEITFVQFTKHTNKMLKLFAQTRMAHMLGPFLTMALQMGSQDLQVDEQLVKRVKKLLQDLLAKSQDQLQNLVQRKDDAQATFEATNGQTATNAYNLQVNLEQLQSDVTQLDKCIVTQQGIVNTATAKFDRNSQLKEDAENLCNVAASEHESATKARKQELKLLAALRERVEARFGQVAQSVKDEEED